MSGEREDRPTVLRNMPASGGGASEGGGRDDKTRVRLPAVGRSGPSGRQSGSDATRHIDRSGHPVEGSRSGGGHTVRMQVVPKRFGWLIVKSGQRVGQVHQLADTTDLGRGPRNQIVIDDERVSDQHARVRIDDDGRFMLWDLASTNGTMVNGERITAATPIEENDEVQVGRVKLVLKTLDIGD